MWRRDQRFPIVSGTILEKLRAGLATYSDDLSTGTKVPEIKTRRMVTVRDDGGTAAGRIQPRRQGVNVWADDPVEAETIALEVIHIAETDLPDGQIIARTSGFIGPLMVDDDAPYIVEGNTLTQYFVSFIADVKAFNA